MTAAEVRGAVQETVQPLRTAFVVQVPEGRCAGIRLPAGGGAAAQRSGGRTAAAVALAAAGCDAGQVGRDPAGRPLPPPGAVVSISHKPGLAVALASHAERWSVGVDVEAVVPARLHIASEVLTVAEQRFAGSASPAAQWTQVLIRFALKEAIYKAAYPLIGPGLEHRDVTVGPLGRGEALCTVGVGLPSRDLVLTGRWFWWSAFVIAHVRLPAGVGEKLGEQKGFKKGFSVPRAQAGRLARSAMDPSA